MKVTLFMATSLNGIIAKENGEEDFLSHKNWETLSELVNKFGNLVVGRKTYEAVKKWDGDYNFDDFNKAEKIIVSADSSLKLDKSYTLAKAPKEAVATLSKKGFVDILVTGGSILNTSFIKSNLLSEIVLNVEPVLVGKGILLFYPDNFERHLKLTSIKKLSGDIIQLHYTIQNR